MKSGFLFLLVDFGQGILPFLATWLSERAGVYLAENEKENSRDRE